MTSGIHPIAAAIEQRRPGLDIRLLSSILDLQGDGADGYAPSLGAICLRSGVVDVPLARARLSDLVADGLLELCGDGYWLPTEVAS